MHPILRLCVCLYLLSTCVARPNWHHGLIEQNEDPLVQVQAVDQKNQATFESANSNEQGKAQRTARQGVNPLFFGAGFSLGAPPGFNNRPPPQYQFYDRQSFGQPMYQQQYGPGHHPIGQLASTLQNIIGSHLEATAQLNKGFNNFGSFNNGFHNAPGLQPPCPWCNQQANSFGETSHHTEIGPPKIISSSVQTQKVEITCSGSETGCRDVPMHSHPNAEEPFPPSMDVIKGNPETQPSSVRPTTSAEGQEFNKENEKDLFFGGDDKDSKNLGTEDEAGIDIRFGAGNP